MLLKNPAQISLVVVRTLERVILQLGDVLIRGEDVEEEGSASGSLVQGLHDRHLILAEDEGLVQDVEVLLDP